QGGVAAAGGHVEHAVAGPQAGVLGQALGHGHDPGGHRGVVGAGPGLLLALLDRSQVRLDGIGRGGAHVLSPVGFGVGVRPAASGGTVGPAGGGGPARGRGAPAGTRYGSRPRIRPDRGTTAWTGPSRSSSSRSATSTARSPSTATRSASPSTTTPPPRTSP